MKTNLIKSTICLTGALTTVACGDPLEFAQDLDDSRVIGVRIESEHGLARAEPGEPLSVQLLLAGPEGPVTARVAVRVCEVADSARGVPFCDGATYADETLDESAAPHLTLDVPSDAEPERRIAVLGVACETGEPELSGEPTDWECSDDQTRPLRFSFDAYVDDDTNEENPALADLVVLVGDEEVPTEAIDVETSCEDAVKVPKDETLDVALALGSGSRQEDETLQISHFATGGRYERQFTVLDPTEPVDFLLEWESPEESKVVKHYVVVRDGQGGVAWASWSVCAQ